MLRCTKNALSSYSLQKKFQHCTAKAEGDLDDVSGKKKSEKCFGGTAQALEKKRAQAWGTQGVRKQTSYSNLSVNPTTGRADVSVALWSTLILHLSLSSLSLCQALSAQTSLQISLLSSAFLCPNPTSLGSRIICCRLRPPHLSYRPAILPNPHPPSVSDSTSSLFIICLCPCWLRGFSFSALNASSYWFTERDDA